MSPPRPPPHRCCRHCFPGGVSTAFLFDFMHSNLSLLCGFCTWQRGKQPDPGTPLPRLPLQDLRSPGLPLLQRSVRHQTRRLPGETPSTLSYSLKNTAQFDGILFPCVSCLDHVTVTDEKRSKYRAGNSKKRREAGACRSFWLLKVQLRPMLQPAVGSGDTHSLTAPLTPRWSLK